MMRKVQRGLRGLFTWKTVAGILIGLVLGATIMGLVAQGPLRGLYGTAWPAPSGGYTCFPTCDEQDGKFLSHPGENMDSFAGARIVLWISVPSNYTSFELGFFDGDSGKDASGNINVPEGNWDNTEVETTYTLYIDPQKNGNGTTVAAEWHGNQDPMPNNDWYNVTVTVAPEAQGAGEHYYYRLECTRPAEGTGINAFKVRSNAYLSTGRANLSDASFSVVGMLGTAQDVPILYPEFNGDYNNPGPSVYTGEWSFPLYIADEQVTVDFWDGDFDRGTMADTDADSDDFDTEGRPYWAGTNSVDEGARGRGSPADDFSNSLYRRSPAVRYEIIDPVGDPVYSNEEPSGTEEWEKFTVSTDPNVQADLQASRLQAGTYTWHIVGLDVHNTVWIRTNYEVCAPEGCPPPLCPECEVCEPCETPTPIPPAPTATPVPTVPPEPSPCPDPVPIDLLYVLDVSGSMDYPYPGPGTKLDAAKQAIVALNDWVAQQNNGSRVALGTFHGSGSGSGQPPTFSTDIQLAANFTTDIGAFNNVVQGLNASGSTPTAETLNMVANWLPGNYDPNHLPVVILISDGVPTVDLDHYGFQDEYVQVVSIYDSSGNPRSPDQVRADGHLYQYYNQRAGEPLADTMLAIQNLKNVMPNVQVYSVAVQATQGGIFNDDILKYIAAQGGGESFFADDSDSLVASLQWAFVDSACGTPPPPPPPAGCEAYTLQQRGKVAPRMIALQIRNDSGENRQITHIHVDNWPSGWGNLKQVRVIGQDYYVDFTPPADGDVNNTWGAGQNGTLRFRFDNNVGDDDPAFSGYIELDNGCQIDF